MSILESLRRLIDPISHREEQAERRKAREQPEYRFSGDPPRTGASDSERTDMFICSACGHRAADRTFCPTCLADTMRSVEEEEGAP